MVLLCRLGELKPNTPCYPDKVPDLDNLIKFVLDALNEQLYRFCSALFRFFCRLLSNKLRWCWVLTAW